jgi:predicted metal-dependent hydrolase
VIQEERNYRLGGKLGTRRIALKLARLPNEMIDHVLLHELVHTRIKNHTNVFWIELNRLVVDAKAKSKKLNEYKMFLL